MEGGCFGEGEEELDVVVAVFEFAVGEGEDRGLRPAAGVGGLDGGVIETDEWGGGRGVGGHGGWVGRGGWTGVRMVGACEALWLVIVLCGIWGLVFLEDVWCCVSRKVEQRACFNVGI